MAEPACGHDMETTSPPAASRCPVCSASFTRVRRQLFCSEACRKSAWRRRQAAARAPVVVPAPRRRRDVTVYACSDCEPRYFGAQWCPDCNRPCRRVGLGGLCPHCDAPVAVADLVNLDTPTSEVTQ